MIVFRKSKQTYYFNIKKPEYIYRKNGAEWQLWKQPYFRYRIYEEQQNLLLHIYNSFGDQVLVLYAAPAIKTINELVEKYKKKEIIDSSNFTEVANLNNHKKNTYIEAGNFSIACSKPEKIKKIDLLNRIRIKREEYKVKETSNYEIILNFKNKITSIINENKFYSRPFVKLTENLHEFSKYELLHSFLVMSSFNQITGVQWLIVL